jgi:hypothetical protein
MHDFKVRHESQTAGLYTRSPNKDLRSERLVRILDNLQPITLWCGSRLKDGHFQGKLYTMVPFHRAMNRADADKQKTRASGRRVEGKGWREFVSGCVWLQGQSDIGILQITSPTKPTV